MSLFSFVRHTLVFLIAISVASTTYLYLYPAFHGCAFPPQRPSVASPTLLQGSLAPFRLLALGDPQIEGDSSLSRDEDTTFPALAVLWRAATGELTAANAEILKGRTLPLVAKDIWRIIKKFRKRIDLIGNDYYLAHIYRTQRWWTQPTHVTVLGDLIGSQWVTDEEFERRGSRFWNRVFKHGRRVEDEITGRATEEVLGADEAWNRRIINIAGNHDIGYAGDLSRDRLVRFERMFGRANWDIRFQVPFNMTQETRGLGDANKELPELRLVVLNSLNLDAPARDTVIQTETYDFLNEVITTSRPVEDKTVATILLTHLPLHKEHGICVDGPFFDFYSGAYGNGLKEQNHISYDAGKGILEGLFGMSSSTDAAGGGLGRKGIILSGHDHEGCDVYHHIPPTVERNDKKWEARRWADSGALINDTIPGIREITVRSMMGDFSGNAGLLSAWFDPYLWRWNFEYSTCAIGVQHIWWAIHIIDFITLLCIVCFSVWLTCRSTTRHTSSNPAGAGPLQKTTDCGFLVGKDNNGIATSTQRAYPSNQNSSTRRNKKRETERQRP